MKKLTLLILTLSLGLAHTSYSGIIKSKEEQLNKYSENDLSFNAATLGPRNIHNKTLFENSLGMYINVETITLSKL